MPTDDAAALREAADALLGQIRAQVCCCEDAAGIDIPEQIAAARAEMDRLLGAYRKAVEAALLAGASKVTYNATGDPAFGAEMHRVDGKPFAPGTCVPAYLVLNPEGK